MNIKEKQSEYVEMLRQQIISHMQLVISNAERAIFLAKNNRIINSLGELQLTAHSADIACVKFVEAKRALDLINE